jgi:hypothetical protein
MDGKPTVCAVSGKQNRLELRVHQAVHTWIANPRFIAVSGKQNRLELHARQVRTYVDGKPRFGDKQSRRGLKAAVSAVKLAEHVHPARTHVAGKTTVWR